ncbi:MAG: ferredoxin [Bacilli bacterium]
MKVKVLEDTCIGCGACQAICGDVFEINDDGLAQAITTVIAADLEDSVHDAIEGCPVNAIVEE